METLKSFLATVFLGALTPGNPIAPHVSLWDRQTRRSSHLPLTETGAPDSITATAQALDNAGHDAYFGVGLRPPGLTPSQRGTRADVIAIPGFWLDIDALCDLPEGVAAPHAARNLPTDEAQIASILEAIPFAPSVVVDSGYGWHVYWLFDAPQPINAANQGVIDLESKAFQEPAIAHAATLGWHVDQTGNLDRVLRLPGTHNHKIPTHPRQVTVLLDDGPRYPYATLAAFARVAMGKQIALAQAPVQAAPPPGIATPTGSPAPVAPTMTAVRAALGNLKNPQTAALLGKVLRGESFAEPGKRDETLQRIAAVIGYVAPDADAEDLARDILGPSLQQFDDVDAGTEYTQETRIAWAAKKIAINQASKRAERAAEQAQNAGIHDALIRQARNAPRRDPKLPQGSGPYTADEIEAFSAQQETTPAGFRKRWIIQKNQSFYVYVNGAYQAAISKDELAVSLPRDLAPAARVISLETIDSKGNSRAKTAAELLRDYGSVARNLVADLSLQHSRYDEATQTFWEAVCPLRPLTPAFDPDVDHWLRLLGGAEADKLLDWIASMTDLSRQSCALYLEGRPGTGKSLLTKGLARVWTTGSPTELIRVLGDWSADIARCPLIVADEQIPQTFRGQRTSAELRLLIGSSSRTLTRKFRDNADIKGAVRLILAANNSELLIFDEALSASDMEAVAGRFLHIVTPETAKAYLEATSTDDWVDGDRIARHALWLRDNRAVIPGRRFLVEGKADAMSKMLATQGDVPGKVTEWLAKFLADTTPKAGPTQRGYIIVGGGKYLVNTNALVEFWDTYVKSDHRAPTHHKLGAALRNLAGAQTRAGNKRFWEVDADIVIAWAERNQVGDADLMRARIATPLPDDAPAAGMLSS